MIQMFLILPNYFSFSFLLQKDWTELLVNFFAIGIVSYFFKKFIISLMNLKHYFISHYFFDKNNFFFRWGSSTIFSYKRVLFLRDFLIFVVTDIKNILIGFINKVIISLVKFRIQFLTKFRLKKVEFI